MCFLDAQAVDHDPSDGFTWEFTVFQSVFNRPILCLQRIKTGKYRFVYFWLP